MNILCTSRRRKVSGPQKHRFPWTSRLRNVFHVPCTMFQMINEQATCTVLIKIRWPYKGDTYTITVFQHAGVANEMMCSLKSHTRSRTSHFVLQCNWGESRIHSRSCRTGKMREDARGRRRPRFRRSECLELVSSKWFPNRARCESMGVDVEWYSPSPRAMTSTYAITQIGIGASFVCYIKRIHIEHWASLWRPGGRGFWTNKKVDLDFENWNLFRTVVISYSVEVNDGAVYMKVLYQLWSQQPITQFQDRYSATKSYSFGHLGDESSLKECQLLRHDNGIELGASIMASRALPILLKMFQTSSICNIRNNSKWKWVAETWMNEWCLSASYIAM